VPRQVEQRRGLHVVQMVQHRRLMPAQHSVGFRIAHMPLVAGEVNPRVTPEHGLDIFLGHFQVVYAN